MHKTLTFWLFFAHFLTPSFVFASSSKFQSSSHRSKKVELGVKLARKWVHLALKNLNEGKLQSPQFRLYSRVRELEGNLRGVSKFLNRRFRVRYHVNEFEDYSICKTASVAAFVQRDNRNEIFFCRRAFERGTGELALFIIHEMTHKHVYAERGLESAKDECTPDEVAQLAAFLGGGEPKETAYSRECPHGAFLKSLISWSEKERLSSVQLRN